MALVASKRIQVTYVVSGQTHIMRQYCKTSGSSPAYGIVLADASSIPFTDAAQGLWDAMKKAWTSAVHASDVVMELQAHSGLVWNPLQFATVVNNAGGGNIQLAGQLTVVLRHQDFTKSKVIIMEGTGDSPSHFPVEDAAGNASQKVAAEWTAAATVTNPPVSWAVSRSNSYLLDHGVAGITNTFNRKIRRARGFL